MNASLNGWQKYLEAGIKYLGEGNTAEAEKHFFQSLREAEALNVPVIIAFSQRLLATAQVRNNKLERAEAGFRRALSLCKELKNPKGIAEAKAGLAGIYSIRGQYSDAVVHYKQAVCYYPVEASPLRLAVLYTDLGQVYSKMKNWKKAEEAFVQAGQLCKSNGYHKGEAEICLYIGEIKYCQGYAEIAKDYFIQAAKAFALVNDEPATANAHQYLAFTLLELGRIHEAIFYQNRVIALFLKKGGRQDVSDGFYLLSNILQHAGLLDEAESTMHRSIAYCNGLELGLAVRYHCLAAIAIMKKDYDVAKNHYFEALRYFQLYGDGNKVGNISEELTYLLRYEDISLKNNFSKWLTHRYINKDLPKYEVMIRLANSHRVKGNNIAALKYGWRALEVAKAMKMETQEIEEFIQNLSKTIRRKK